MTDVDRASAPTAPDARDALVRVAELALFLACVESAKNLAVLLRESFGVPYAAPSSNLVWGLWTAALWTALVAWFGSWRGEPLTERGLRTPARGWRRAVAVGCAGAVAIWLLLRGTAEAVHALYGLSNRAGVFDFGPAASVVRLLVATTILGGFAEELVFRGFLLGRIERLLAPWISPWRARAGAVVGSSLVFAIGHAGQGELALAVTFVVGCALAVMYLYVGRELPQVMIAHALIDVLEVLYGHALA